MPKIKNSPKPSGVDDSSIINLTNDDRIHGYVAERITLAYYENTQIAKDCGILAAVMFDSKAIVKINEIKEILKAVGPATLRSYLCECIISRKSLLTILDSINQQHIKETK